jgi:hypothetical protein
LVVGRHAREVTGEKEAGRSAGFSKHTLGGAFFSGVATLVMAVVGAVAS